MKKTCKLNLYTAADVAGVITLLLLVLFMMKKSDLKWAFIPGTIFMLFGLIQGFWGQSKVENQSGKTIATKPEEGCVPENLSAGGERYDIDGVRVNGRVYKAGDGTHIVVKPDGTIKTKSIIGTVINKVRGGYLSAAPDDCWKKMFI